MNRLSRLIGLVLAVALLAGCGRSAITSAPPLVVTPVVVASLAAVLTPTFTPEPTATLTAVPATATAFPSTSTALPPTTTPEPTTTATAIPPTPTPAPTLDIVLTPVSTVAQPGQHPYLTTLQISTSSGVTQSVQVGFLLYLPRAYGQDPARAWPLILFLHGSGENGTDPELVAVNGLPELLIDDADYPFIVVSPQAAPEADWNTQLRPLMALVDYVQRNYAVDVKRTYLTGLSMGGFGAWDLALNYPKRFAAAVPIAGGWIFDSAAIPQRICDLKDMPIWVFHGAQDDIVSPRQSQSLVDALKQCGSGVRFTLYPEADHRDSWKLAYSDPALFEWLLAQQLP